MESCGILRRLRKDYPGIDPSVIETVLAEHAAGEEAIARDILSTLASS